MEAKMNDTYEKPELEIIEVSDDVVTVSDVPFDDELS